MLFNLFKLGVVAAAVSTLSASALTIISAKDAVSKRQTGLSAEFCQTFNFGGDCVFLFPENDGECLSFAGFVATNGISSFTPLQSNVSCSMFTGTDCNGDVWHTAMAIPDFQFISFNGVSPNNAINSAMCTGGS